jgi:rare lipoprotein A
MIKLFLVFVIVVSCSHSPRYYQDVPINENKFDKSEQKENKNSTEYTEKGIASFSADEQHGKPTASGEIYNMRQLVAAHPKLPFGTIVKVTNTINDKTVWVRIIDRGPFVKGRIIDLSFEAAKKLKFIDRGTTVVNIEVVKPSY